MHLLYFISLRKKREVTKGKVQGTKLSSRWDGVCAHL